MARIFDATLYTLDADRAEFNDQYYARCGYYQGMGRNIGFLTFNGIDSYLTGKTITSITFSVTPNEAGAWNKQKTVNFWSSNIQSKPSSVSQAGTSYVNSLLGDISILLKRNETTTFTLTSGSLFNGIANQFSNGNTTIAIFNPSENSGSDYSTNYLCWTSVSIIVEYGDVIGIPVAPSSTDLGSSIGISINNYYSGAQYTLSYACGSASGTIASLTSNSSVSWTVPAALASYITSTSANCTITCETFYGGASRGTRACVVTVNVPSSYKPSTPTISLNPSSGFTQALTTIQFTITSYASDSGAGSLSYRTAFDGNTYTSSSFTAIPNSSGNLTISTTVTDGRGRSSTASTTISVQAYDRPVINSFTVTRCDSSGNPQTDGDHISASFSGTIGESSGSYEISYKASTTSGDNWTSSASGSFSGTSYSNSFVLSQTFSDSIGYDLRLTFSDSKSSAIQIANIGSKSVVFDVVHYNNKDGIAFGEVAANSGVERITSAWPLYFSNNNALAQTKANLGISGDSNYVSKAGDTMTGDLTLDGGYNTSRNLGIHTIANSAGSQDGDLFMRFRANAYNTTGGLAEIAIYDNTGASGAGRGLRLNSLNYSSNMKDALDFILYNSSGSAYWYPIMHTGWVNFYSVYNANYPASHATSPVIASSVSSLKVAFGTLDNVLEGGTTCYFGITFSSIPMVFCEIYAGTDTTAQSAYYPNLQVRSVTTSNCCISIPGGATVSKVCWMAIGN